MSNPDREEYYCTLTNADDRATDHQLANSKVSVLVEESKDPTVNIHKRGSNENNNKIRLEKKDR